MITYEKGHNSYDSPCFLLNFDIQGCQLTLPYNSSLRTHRIFSYFANEMAEGQKLGETHRRLCKEQYWPTEEKVSPDIIFYFTFSCVTCSVLCVFKT